MGNSAITPCRDEDVWTSLEEITWENEQLVETFYGIGQSERGIVDLLYGSHPAEYSD